MGWKATVEEAAAVAAEGEYDAEVLTVRDMDGQHGPMVRIEFALSTDEEWDGHRVSGIASKRLSETTRLGRWLTAILGRTPAVGEEITVEDLLHKRCRVVVKHKTSPDGKTFANVVEVLSSNVPF
jgi:hypothetical protein